VFKDEEALNEPFEAEHDELERPTIETIDKAAAEAAERLSDVQVLLRRAVSETTVTDVDPLSELFDDADDAFVRHLLEGMREPPLPENLTNPRVGSAQAVSETPTVTAGDQPAHDVFDAQDDAFVVRLMEGTPGTTRESADQTDAQPLKERAEIEPSPPEDS
jgi:hypothetical protein